MPQLKKILIEKKMEIPWGFRRGDRGGREIMAPDPYFLVAHSNGLGEGIPVCKFFFPPFSSFRPNCERKDEIWDFLRDSFHNRGLDLQKL